MLKNILQVNGVQKLSKNQQNSVNGGSKDGELILDTNPCGGTGGRIRRNISAFLCAQYGGVYLGNSTCMICH